ncbi:MAG: helix-turn-helix domain-containing protein [Pseudonocardiaceae bacterium]
MTTTSNASLSVREAAARVHRSPETVRRWIWAKKLPARKRGNALYVQATDLDAVAATAHPTRASKPDDASWQTWLTRVDHARVSAEVRGSSSADLVLADRNARAGR